MSEQRAFERKQLFLGHSVQPQTSRRLPPLLYGILYFGCNMHVVACSILGSKMIILERNSKVYYFSPNQRQCHWIKGKEKFERLERLLQSFEFSRAFPLPFPHREKRRKFQNPVKIAHMAFFLLFLSFYHILKIKHLSYLSGFIQDNFLLSWSLVNQQQKSYL